MKPVIYVANRCHQCEMVKEFAIKSGVTTDIHNVDMTVATPPKDVFVYPALFIGEELIAYGEDIIDYYKKNLIN
jgi:glutaredoxin